MFNKKNSNKEKLMNMLGYKPDPSNSRYVYYSELDVDTSKDRFDNADMAEIAFSNFEYCSDTYDAAKNITKRDIDKQIVSEFMKFTINEIADASMFSLHTATAIRNLNLDGSYPNENDLEHRIRAIVQDELNNRKK